MVTKKFQYPPVCSVQLTIFYRNKYACIQCIYVTKIWITNVHRNNSNQSKDNTCTTDVLKQCIVCTGTNMYSKRDPLLGILAKEQ